MKMIIVTTLHGADTYTRTTIRTSFINPTQVAGLCGEH